MLPQHCRLDKVFVNWAATAAFNRGMTIFAAVLASVALAASLAASAADAPPPAPQERSAAPDHGLRQAVQDFFRQEQSPSPPRQLSATERAELRRQLSDYARPASRRH